jgi:hypothetical protein
MAETGHPGVGLYNTERDAVFLAGRQSGVFQLLPSNQNEQPASVSYPFDCMPTTSSPAVTAVDAFLTKPLGEPSD